MGIQSTRKITREEAIQRITEVMEAVSQCNYKEVEWLTAEHDCSLKDFVNKRDLPVSNPEWLVNFTDEMLEETMDKPFYRHSIFDNYWITEEGE